MLLTIFLLPQSKADTLKKSAVVGQLEIAMETPVNPESPMGKGMADALHAALAPLGYKLTVKFFPSRRGLEELKVGRVDGTVGRIGNIPKILGASHLVRIDFPIVSLHLSRWCRKGLEHDKARIIVGSRLGSLVAMMISPHLDPERINLTEIRDQKASVDMLRKNRLDCLISNDLVLATDGITQEDLRDFERFDLMTVQVFPWISNTHESLKPGIEKGLRLFAFSREFRQTFQELKPACENQFSVLCPDGLLIRKSVDFR
jgi:hypothetical protein